MTTNPAQYVLNAFRNEAANSADSMRSVLSYAARALRGAVEDEITRNRYFGQAEELGAVCDVLLRRADELEAMRARAVLDEWHFGDQGTLEGVMIDLRALPVANDSTDSDNPIHNATVWTIDAIRYGAILARVNVTSRPWQDGRRPVQPEPLANHDLLGRNADMWTLPVPEAFASNPVVAAIKVADDPTEHPHKYVIITQDRTDDRSFNVHTITYNGTQWVSGQGRYDMAWSRALDRIGHLAKVLGRPAGQGSGQ